MPCEDVQVREPELSAVWALLNTDEIEDVRSARRTLAEHISKHPSDINSRELLAESYRKTGEHDQAGRWAFLSGAASAEELAAFANGFSHDPFAMMRVLRLDNKTVEAFDGPVRERLNDLHDRAIAIRGRRVRWNKPGRAERRSVRDGLTTALVGGYLLLVSYALIRAAIDWLPLIANWLLG